MSTTHRHADRRGIGRVFLEVTVYGSDEGQINDRPLVQATDRS